MKIDQQCKSHFVDVLTENLIRFENVTYYNVQQTNLINKGVFMGNWECKEKIRCKFLSIYLVFQF